MQAPDGRTAAATSEQAATSGPAHPRYRMAETPGFPAIRVVPWSCSAPDARQGRFSVTEAADRAVLAARAELAAGLEGCGKTCWEV